MNTFSLQVLRINETIFDGQAISLTVPGTIGEITILAKHETMLSSLSKGEVVIRPETEEQLSFEIEHGFIEATLDRVTVLL